LRYGGLTGFLSQFGEEILTDTEILAYQFKRAFGRVLRRFSFEDEKKVPCDTVEELPSIAVY
jgi:hypothetical protein